MKPIFTLMLAGCMSHGFAVAQTSHCHFDSIHHVRLSYPGMQETAQQMEENILLHGTVTPMSGNVKILPLVIHIIHHGGVENISDAQVYSQMDVLDKDFRRLNSDTTMTDPVFHSVAADMEMEFCLASLDPDGNPTSGIERHYTTNTSMDMLTMIQQYGWDNDRYINIYISGHLGCFSSFPGDPDSVDGIFITHGRFGTIGTAGTEQYAEFAKFGRTATHELGHYLGLYHTFSILSDCDSACATSGDKVCDTPPADLRWFVSSCLDSMNTCFEIPDLPDQVDNYMDYNVDSCANMFSYGQKERINAVLAIYRPSLYTDTNLVFTGCALPTGIKEPEVTHVTLYPNPMDETATLAFSNPQQEMHRLIIYDVQGKVVRNMQITGHTALIEKRELQSGLYFYRLFSVSHMIGSGKLLIK